MGYVLAGAAVLCIGMLGFSAISSKMNQDPVVTGIQAEFVGEARPGEPLKKSMFEVKGVTESGKLVKLNDFGSEDEAIAMNGDMCEIEINSQGYSTTAIVNITRTPIFQQHIGFPEEESVTVTCYDNGDLDFTGKGPISNFANGFPWAECQYSHVYIDENIKIENMDSWFEGNQALVYCDDIPKSVKTMQHTFAGCTAMEKTPNYFQCSNVKMMDYAFSGCVSLQEMDVIPVNVESTRYTFENCTGLQKPVDLSKTSNLTDITGIHTGCTSLRYVMPIPKSVIYMSQCFQNCINIKDATVFPPNVLDISNAYSGDKGLLTAASIPESVINFSGCYNGCASLTGSLEINSDTSDFGGVLVNATTNGDKLKLSGNSGNLLAIQKDSGNKKISLADPEAAARQNERMLREQEG